MQNHWTVSFSWVPSESLVYTVMWTICHTWSFRSHFLVRYHRELMIRIRSRHTNKAVKWMEDIKKNLLDHYALFFNVLICPYQIGMLVWCSHVHNVMLVYVCDDQEWNSKSRRYQYPYHVSIVIHDTGIFWLEWVKRVCINSLVIIHTSVWLLWLANAWDQPWLCLLLEQVEGNPWDIAIWHYGCCLSQ